MIRKANEEDISHLVHLISQDTETLLPRSEQEYREVLNTTWVAEADGKVVGGVVLEVYSPKIAEVRSCVVHKDYRHRGYGKRLIETAVAAANEQKIREIIVVTSNKDYFQKLNFGECLHEKYVLFWNGK